MCLFMGIPSVFKYPWSPEEGFKGHGDSQRGLQATQHGHWELNLNLLEEHHMLLTTELSF